MKTNRTIYWDVEKNYKIWDKIVWAELIWRASTTLHKCKIVGFTEKMVKITDEKRNPHTINYDRIIKI